MNQGAENHVDAVIKTVDPFEIDPITWFNETQAQYIINHFVSKPLGKFTSVNSFSYTIVKELKNKPMIVYENGNFMAVMDNDLGLPVGELYSPFRMLVEFIYKKNYHRAIWFIVYELMNNKTPYIRVGVKYYKVIQKKDRNSILRTELKVWDKTTLVDDYGSKILAKIPNYDDFTIEPDNKTFNQIRGNNYNLYAPFEHTPADSFKEDDLPWTNKLMKHIFGEQLELGFMYLKVLYDLPTQKLPILVLISEERGTGKTTFLDFLELLFGANTVVINPQDIANSFNGAYATSNIIMIEESRFESVQATEKLKNLATQKKIMVNTKFVQQYSIPFHGKLIITSNDENKFSKVDDSEIRYWVRKIPTLTGKANHGILNDLKNEIPYLLAKLNSMPEIDTSKSRMVFDSAAIQTEALQIVKRESRSSLMKELELLFDSHSAENPGIYKFEFIAKDLKEAWFNNNPRIEINYINSVLSREMKLERGQMKRYNPLGISNSKRSGTPYEFINPYYDPEKEVRRF